MKRREKKYEEKSLESVLTNLDKQQVNNDNESPLQPPNILKNKSSFVSDNNRSIQVNFDRVNLDLMNMVKTDPYIGLGSSYKQPPAFVTRHSIN
jgi:hypothetical protein